MKIGVIGFGTFGQFLAGRFRAHGIEVVATSRSNYSRKAEELGVVFCPDVSSLFATNPDIILLSMSILSFEKVVSTLPLEKCKGKLFVDVLSVKASPKEYLKRTLPNDVDILCTHPMFGPDSGKDSWSGLNFMYEKVRVRDQKMCDDFLEIFKQEGCEMIEMSSEKHDMYAASSQFITHTTGRILDRLHLKNTPINTKGYEQLLHLINNTTNDSFELYYGLYAQNAKAKEQLALLEEALRDLRNTLFERARGERSHVIVGIQGGEGSFNHEAAKELIAKYNLEHVELQYLITSEAVLQALNQGRIDYGVFAIENSGSGTVLPSIYSMSKYPHEIIEVHDMKLTQCLLTRPGQEITKAKKIVTHPQAIRQCRKTISSIFPYLQSDYLSDDYDTATCARELAAGRYDEDTVVIASKTAADLHGLKIVHSPLNDDPENFTSFVFCKRREH